MSLLSNIGRFLSELIGGPEAKVNRLLSVISRATSDISDEEKIGVLRSAIEINGLIQMDFDALQRRSSNKSEGVSKVDIISNYIVAITDTILALLGEDTSPGTHRSLEEQERMRRSCQAQRESINWSIINKDKLFAALSRSYGIKTTWKHLNDERWLNLSRITQLEFTARQEWFQTHMRNDDV